MPVTWIEVADTAVKIGLGALITGLSSYFLATRNHNHTLSRELSSKKIKLLEHACEEAEKYFSYTTRLYNIVAAFARNNETSGRDQNKVEYDAINNAHEDFRDALESRNKAIANASLLGAIEPIEHLNAFNDTLDRFRTTIAYEGKMLTNAEHRAFTDEFRAHKRSFYAAASLFLNRFGSGR